MDAPRRVFKLTYIEGDWYWRLDIMNDDGLIGPFLTRDDAEKDARETLGIRKPRRHLVAIEPAPRPLQSSPPRAKRYTLAARAIRLVSMSATFVLIIVVALLCVTLLAVFGILWAAPHFGVCDDEDDWAKPAAHPDSHSSGEV
jgi:hypothetical protein